MNMLKDMNSLQLSVFLLENNLAKQGQAEKICSQDIDGDILLSMSAEELMSHANYSFSRASRLVNWLRSNVNVAAILDERGTNMEKVLEHRPVAAQRERDTSEEASKEKVLEERPTGIKNLCSSSNSERTRMGRLKTALPRDPVTEFSDLRVRVFGKKPVDEYTNMWGKGYLQSFHPIAHATHNRNIEKMRGFFCDVYNHVVANAWNSNFRFDKQELQDTLNFIEECVPQLEKLFITIGGVDMYLSWTTQDIFHGWFLDHKKHNSSKRLARIASLQAEGLAGWRSSEGPSDLPKERDCNQETEGFGWQGEEAHSPSMSKMTIDRVVDSPGTDVHSPCTNVHSPSTDVHSPGTDGSEVAQDIGIGGESLIDSNDTHDISLRGRSASSSPQHKPQNKIPLLVGVTENRPHNALGAKVLFAQDLLAMPGLVRYRLEPSLSDTSTDAHSPNPSMTSTETDDSDKLKHRKRSIQECYDASDIKAPTARRSMLPKSLQTIVSSCPNIPDDALVTSSKKILKLSLVQNSISKCREDKLGSRNSISKCSKDKLGSISMTKVKEYALQSTTPKQLLGIDNLDEDAKLIIAYKAMKVSNKKEVKPQLKSYMAAQNYRVQQLNASSSSSSKMTIPFSGHQGMDIADLLDLLVKWALENKVKIVHAPKPMNGKIRLYAQHVQDK